MTHHDEPLPKTAHLPLNLWQFVNEVALTIHRGPSFAESLEAFAASVVELQLARSVVIGITTRHSDDPRILLERPGQSGPGGHDEPGSIDSTERMRTVFYRIGLETSSILSLEIEIDRNAGLSTQLALESLCEHLDIASRNLPLPNPPGSLPLTPLSGREREVLEHLLHGKSNPEIGDILGISGRTVEKHVSAILRKYRCESRVCLMARLHRPNG